MAELQLLHELLQLAGLPQLVLLDDGAEVLRQLLLHLRVPVERQLGRHILGLCALETLPEGMREASREVKRSVSEMRTRFLCAMWHLHKNSINFELTGT